MEALERWARPYVFDVPADLAALEEGEFGQRGAGEGQVRQVTRHWEERYSNMGGESNTRMKIFTKASPQGAQSGVCEKNAEGDTKRRWGPKSGEARARTEQGTSAGVVLASNCLLKLVTSHIAVEKARRARGEGGRPPRVQPPRLRSASREQRRRWPRQPVIPAQP